MLAGIWRREKDPGHFVGKGYLKITFDRVIVPTGDIPLPAKVIQAKGYKVDKQGDIQGQRAPQARRCRVDDSATLAVESGVAAGPRAAANPERGRADATAFDGRHRGAPQHVSVACCAAKLVGSLTTPRNLPVSLAAPNSVSTVASHPDRPPYASSNSPKFIGGEERHSRVPCSSQRIQKSPQQSWRTRTLFLPR